MTKYQVKLTEEAYGRYELEYYFVKSPLHKGRFLNLCRIDSLGYREGNVWFSTAANNNAMRTKFTEKQLAKLVNQDKIPLADVTFKEVSEPSQEPETLFYIKAILPGIDLAYFDEEYVNEATEDGMAPTGTLFLGRKDESFSCKNKFTINEAQEIFDKIDPKDSGYYRIVKVDDEEQVEG